MSVAAIIVNYKTGALVLSHLPAIMAALRAVPGSMLYVVDNASPGGDAALLREGLAGTQDARLIEAPKNGGFAYGNNIALRDIMRGPLPHHILFLNPDAYPRPGAVSALIDAMEADAGLAIAGGRIENEDGSPRASAFSFPTAVKEFSLSSSLGILSALFGGPLTRQVEGEAPVPCDWVTGAAFMLRGALLEEVGLMDERYFLYFEEVDFMLSVRRKGHRIASVPKARFVHFAGQSTGIKEGSAVMGDMPVYWYESWRRYYTKNHGRPYAMAAALARASGMTIAEAKARLLRRPQAAGRIRLRSFAQHCLRPALFGGQEGRGDV